MKGIFFFHPSFLTGVFQTKLDFKGIMGQHVFTGCLYAGPSWGPLAWAPVFFVEGKSMSISNNIPCISTSSHLTHLLQINLIVLGTLVILMIYKCRSYEVFTPTLVVHSIRNQRPIIIITFIHSIKILARDSIIYFIGLTGQSLMHLKVRLHETNFKGGCVVYLKIRYHWIQHILYSPTPINGYDCGFVSSFVKQMVLN